MSVTITDEMIEAGLWAWILNATEGVARENVSQRVIDLNWHRAEATITAVLPLIEESVAIRSAELFKDAWDQIEARVKPSRENLLDVVREAIADSWSDTEEYAEAPDRITDAVLALLPGRTEAGVRAEALQEAAEQFFIPSQGLGHYLAVDFAETLGREFLRGYAERIARGGERS